MLSHIAMTVARESYTEEYLSELTRFYQKTLGWRVDDNLSRPNERLFITIGNEQYLNVRSADEPMVTSGYEHLGIYLDTPEAVHDLHARVIAEAQPDNDLEIDKVVRVLYSGALTTFRFRYLMPLAIEVQYLKRKPG